MTIIARLISLGVACVALNACAKAQIEHHSDSFNRAVGESGLEQVLLNVVRASKDEPASFTKLIKYTTDNMLKGSLAPKLPFGPDATSIFDLGPTLNLSTGANLIEYGDVNTSEGLKELDSRVPYGVFHDANLKIRVKATLFIGRFEIHEVVDAALKKQWRAMCRPGPEKDSRCQIIRATNDRCGTDWWSGPPLPFAGGRYFVYANSATSVCEYLRFQATLSLLSLSGFIADAKIEEYPVVKDKEKVIGRRSIAVVNFLMPATRSAFQAVERRFKERRIASERPINIVLRSPRDMIDYLGEIVALENYSAVGFVPEVQISDEVRVPFFMVFKDADIEGPNALSVTDRHGDVFVVPQPRYGDRSRHQTLRVLTVLTDLVNASISAKGLPLATSVVVRGVD